MSRHTAAMGPHLATDVLLDYWLGDSDAAVAHGDAAVGGEQRALDSQGELITRATV